MTQKVFARTCFNAFLLLISLPAQALIISDELEVLRIPAVGFAWQSVTVQNSYTNPPVVTCTYNLPSAADNEAVVRLNNVSVSGFDIKIQRPVNSSAVTASDVYCLVAEPGLHTLPDGRIFEAHTVTSNGTNGRANGWGEGGPNGAENVSGSVLGTYPNNSQPAVLGQVMSYNDEDFSAFWSFDCDSRSNVPFQSNLADGICVGKHIGQISDSRADETLGYIIIEQGVSPNGSFDGISYRVDLGPSSVAGVGNSPPYAYALGAAYDFAVATQEAENGGQGGWAVLYGTDPLDGNNLDLAIDEETVAGDTTRSHTNEQLAYWAFRGIDRGDAPSSYGDASHVVTGILSLGAAAAGDADAEAVQYSANADADDNTDLDDEDGVGFSAPAGGSSNIVATVTTTGTGTICGWMDVDLSGAFEVGERRCGPANLVWIVSDTLTQDYYSRFRICAVASECDTPTGLANSGEVEDYVITYNPTIVTIGEIGLHEQNVTAFLAELGIAQSNREALLALITSWNIELATEPAGLDNETLLQILQNYLDPTDDGKVTILRWSTLSELGTIGFFVERKGQNTPWVRIHDDMLPGLIDAPMGGEYQLADPAAVPGQPYQYRLVELEARGSSRTYGPYDLELAL